VVLSGLPAGITLDRASGAISGTPLEVGPFAFDVRAVDSNWEGDMDTRTFMLNVVPPPFTAVIPAAAVGRVGLPIDVVMTASGQVGSVLWSVTSGSLPPGIGINSATGIVSRRADGVPVPFTAAVTARTPGTLHGPSPDP
jgi:hypothetical protein